MKSKKIISAVVISAVLASGATMFFSSSNKQSTKNILLFTNNNGYDYCVVNDNRNLVLTNKSGKITSYVSTGEMVEVLNSDKKQSLVKIRETGDIGYINNEDIRFIKSGINSQITSENLIGETINISASVNLRENPSLDSGVLTTLPNNTQLKILGKQGEWFEVCVGNSVGFIYEEYVGVNRINSENSTSRIKERGTNEAGNGKMDDTINNDSNKRKSTSVKKNTIVKPVKQNENIDFTVNKQEFNVSEPSTYSLHQSMEKPILVGTPNSSYKEFSYNQLAAKATINGKSANISFSGNVNNQVPGIYPVEMSVKLSNGKTISKRIDIKIKDLPPVIVLNNTDTVQPGNYIPYSNFIIGAYSVEGENLSNDIECYGSPIGALNQNERLYQGPATLRLSVKDQYGTVGTANDVLTVVQNSRPTITGKNIVLKEGQKFKYSDLNIKVQNGYVYRVEYSTNNQDGDYIQSIPDKKGTYYVWIIATNNNMYTCAQEMYTVTIL